VLGSIGFGCCIFKSVWYLL